MVHALSEVRRVLRPGGSLIDLRPTARNRQVELELSEARLHIGEIDASEFRRREAAGGRGAASRAGPGTVHR